MQHLAPPTSWSHVHADGSSVDEGSESAHKGVESHAPGAPPPRPAHLLPVSYRRLSEGHLPAVPEAESPAPHSPDAKATPLVPDILAFLESLEAAFQHDGGDDAPHAHSVTPTTLAGFGSRAGTLRGRLEASDVRVDGDTSGFGPPSFADRGQDEVSPHTSDMAVVQKLLQDARSEAEQWRTEAGKLLDSKASLESRCSAAEKSALESATRVKELETQVESLRKVWAEEERVVKEKRRLLTAAQGAANKASEEAAAERKAREEAEAALELERQDKAQLLAELQRYRESANKLSKGLSSHSEGAGGGADTGHPGDSGELVSDAAEPKQGSALGDASPGAHSGGTAEEDRGGEGLVCCGERPLQQGSAPEAAPSGNERLLVPSSGGVPVPVPDGVRPPGEEGGDPEDRRREDHGRSAELLSQRLRDLKDENGRLVQQLRVIKEAEAGTTELVRQLQGKVSELLQERDQLRAQSAWSLFRSPRRSTARDARARAGEGGMEDRVYEGWRLEVLHGKHSGGQDA